MFGRYNKKEGTQLLQKSIKKNLLASSTMSLH
jgi:hypothetical protein